MYAAASLRESFPEIDRRPTYNFAGSNQLQLQIERGAPADVFASASPTEAQALFRAGRCTRPVTFATNLLVLLVPNANPGNVRSVYSLRSGGRRLAVGSPGVPIGAYTRRAAVAPAAELDPAHEHGEQRVERRRRRVQGRPRLCRRRLHVRDRRAHRGRSRELDPPPALGAAAGPLPDLRGQATRSRHGRRRGRSSRGSGRPAAARSSGAPASVCHPVASSHTRAQEGGVHRPPRALPGRVSRVPGDPPGGAVRRGAAPGRPRACCAIPPYATRSR